jgi:hypothetical protein
MYAAVEEGVAILAQLSPPDGLSKIYEAVRSRIKFIVAI